MAQWKRIRLGTTRLPGRSLALLSGLRIQHCRELCCRLQTWLRSCIAMAVVLTGSYNSNSTSSLGTSISCRCVEEKKKKKKGKEGRDGGRKELR